MPTTSFLTQFARHVRQSPEAPALHGGGQWHSYAALDALAHVAADRLEASRLPHDARLVVLGPKGPDLVALLIAAWRRGHSVLLPSAELGAASVAALGRAAGADAEIRLDGSTAATLALRIDPVDDAVAPRPASAAKLLLTTSGSTGVPKIVPLTASGVDRFLTWSAEAVEITAGTRVLSYAPLNFDVSLLDLWAPLSVGAVSILVEPELATDAAGLAELVRSTAAQVIQAVPLAFRLIVEGSPEAHLAVRRVIVTGDFAPPELIRALGPAFPVARIHNVYGSTETNDSLWFEVDRAVIDEGSPLPIGRPIAGAAALLVDPGGAVVEGPGEGELWTSTPFQADGYVDPVPTAAAFVDDAFGTGRRFYRTGDLARRDRDGLLHLRGRLDHQVKVSGVRTSLTAIEHVLRQVDDVVDVAVVALPDDQAGHALHAAVQRRAGSALNSLVLRSHSAAHLARTAIPRTLAVADHPLPRTATGKVDRPAIASAFAERNTHVPD